jgi:type II secretion system protein I
MKRAETRGFSLTELLAAMAIFATGIMACIELYSVSLRATANTVDYTQAVFLAQSVIEETIADGYLTASTDDGDFGDTYPRHRWERDIEETDQEALMKIHVVVRWTTHTTEKQYALTTYYAGRDVLDVAP